MSDDMLWILLVRMAERMLAVVIGGGSIYLGFRLFTLMPDLRAGGADVKLPGGVSIMLSRVGPGVFFSLFGAIIASLSLFKPVELPVAKPDGTIAVATAAVGGANGDAARQEAQRGQAQRLLSDLEQVRNQLSTSLDPSARNDALRAISAGRLALLHKVWGPDWGEFENFENWVESGAGAVPAGVPWALAADMFKRRNPP